MKRIISVFLVLLFLVSFAPFSAHAESYKSLNWLVTFTANKSLVSNFETDTIASLLKELQPGDEISIRISVKNEYGSSVDWYMKNEVVKSLESGAANGGGYTYELVYSGPGGGEDVLYSSRRVGGENAPKGYEGLKEATANLKDYFYLDTIASGKTGHVDLKVSLDGETQGNAYQTKNADLTMRFAVEIPDKSVVKTGDDTDFTLLYVGMLIGGLGLMFFVLDGITDRIYFGKRKAAK